MRCICVMLASLALLPSAAAAVPPGDDLTSLAVPVGDGDATPGREVWRVANRCAVNATYLMLRLKGRPADYRTIDAAAPVSKRGTSLAELRQLVTRFGLQARIVKSSPALLSQVSLPAIAHVEEQRGTTGHYIIVTALHPNGIETIDGTSAALLFTPMSEFRKAWTGYLLVEEPAPMATYAVVILVLAGVALVIIGFLPWRSRAAASAAATIFLAALAADKAARAAPPTLDEIASGIRGQWDRVHNLSVEYLYEEEPLDGMKLVKRYLGTKILNKRDSAFAFKGDMRYSKEIYLLLDMKDLAPDTEPDYDVIPDGPQIKQKLDARRASGKLWPQDQDSFRIPLGVHAAFNGVDIRRLEPGDPDALNLTYGSALAIEKPSDIKNEAIYFPQEYLDNLARMVPDAIHKENRREAERLPDAFATGGFTVRPATEEIDGAACVVIEGPRADIFWLDPALNYGVRKREIFDPASKVLQERRQNLDFREVAPGVWLPMLCRRDLCGPPRTPEPYRGKPLLRHKYTVKALVVNDVPDSLFQLKAPPGWMVADATVVPRTRSDGSDKYLGYRMPADERQLNEVVQEAVVRKVERDSKERQRWRRTVVAVAANGLVIALVLVVYLYSKRKRAASPEGPPDQDPTEEGPR